MNKQLNINLFYSEDGENIVDVLSRDFKEFLSSYLKKILK